MDKSEFSVQITHELIGPGFEKTESQDRPAINSILNQFTAFSC